MEKAGKSSFLSAPVLLFLISIAFALATAYMWMGKTGELSQGDESVEVLDCTCALDLYMNWEISVFLNNSGNTPVVLSSIYVNNMEVSKYGAVDPGSIVGTITTDFRKRAEIPRGEVAEVTVWVGAKFGFLTSGSMVSVKILTAGGMEIARSVRLA